MEERKRKFPNGGYDVRIIDKEDVIKCIDTNIIDKEIALEIVKRCELDCANFLREGKLAGIPYMGTIAIPKSKQYLRSPEQKELITEAYNTMDKNRYVMFRKELNRVNEERARFERSYNYIVAMMINRNNELYKKIVKYNSEPFVKVIMYCSLNLEPITEEFKQLYYD